jgi:hypothetical protein
VFIENEVNPLPWERAGGALARKEQFDPFGHGWRGQFHGQLYRAPIMPLGKWAILFPTSIACDINTMIMVV